MSCSQWEIRIAESLDAGMSVAVREHVASCAQCAALLSELEANAAAMRDCDVTGAELRQLQDRVMRQIPVGRRRPVSRVAGWIAAAAAVLTVAVGIGRWKDGEVVPPRQPSVGAGHPPHMALRQSPARGFKGEASRTLQKVARPAPAAPFPKESAEPLVVKAKPPAEKAEPLLVKLVTDDPNIVIYLQSEDKKKGAGE